MMFDRLPIFPCTLSSSLLLRCVEEILSLFRPFQSSSDAPYLARHVGLRVGVPKEVPAFVVNRLCGSGFQSIVSGCQVWTTFYYFSENMLEVIGGNAPLQYNTVGFYFIVHYWERSIFDFSWKSIHRKKIVS